MAKTCRDVEVAAEIGIAYRGKATPSLYELSRRGLQYPPPQGVAGVEPGIELGQ